MHACRIRQGTRVHFVGVGGVGMCGLAEILRNLGYPVSGSDLRESETTRRLSQLGALIRAGHTATNLDLFGEPADVVVVSTAVPKDNPELAGARQRGIPVIARAELLAELMRLKVGIAVAGSHGKTTTTSLVASVLAKAGLDPTAVIGGRLPELGSGARLGQSEYLVAEADESDGSFLHLSPTVAVVTNIDPEHLDHYGDMEHLRGAFVDFLNKLPFYGRAVLCTDHPEVRALLPRVSKRYVTYGLQGGEYSAAELRFSGLRSRFIALHHGQPLGEVEVAMPGAHNVQNALAVLAVCESLGVPFATFQEAMASFQGTLRRFTIRGELVRPGGPVTLVDDYGHHPAEIRATLAAARSGFPGRRIVVAFQPHRYTRTRDLFDEFTHAFDDADRVVLLGIYAAGEAPIPGITAAALAEAVRARLGDRVSYSENRAELSTKLLPELRGGELLITMGAGDITHAADELVRAEREPLRSASS